MSILSRLFGRSDAMQPHVENDQHTSRVRRDLEARRLAVEAERDDARSKLHSSVAAIHSGSRAMSNMAGMMKLMSMTDRIDDQTH